MPEDVAEALDRFKLFLARLEEAHVLDVESGFSAADGWLLAAELELAERARASAEDLAGD